MIPTKYYINIDKINIKSINKSKTIKLLTEAIEQRDAVKACSFAGILCIVNMNAFWDYVLCNAGGISVLYHIYNHYKKYVAENEVQCYDYNTQEFRNAQAEIIGLLCFPILSDVSITDINVDNFISIMTEYYTHKDLECKTKTLKKQKVKMVNRVIPEIIELVMHINHIYLEIQGIIKKCQ